MEILLFLHPLCLVDLVAQLVEHNTFNVGALGSNPSGITPSSQSAFSSRFSLPDSLNVQGLFSGFIHREIHASFVFPMWLPIFLHTHKSHITLPI